MANNEHLQILARGVATWNKWRKRNSTIQPDLSKAELNNVNLSRANLEGANLNKANLNNANLSRVNLECADLNEANLEEANLRKANLKRAKLYQAVLNMANLEEADLEEANLRVADLTAANLYKANLCKAKLRNADLSETDLRETDLHEADLSETDLYGAELYRANLSKANLYRANLESAYLTEANLNEADLNEAYLFSSDLTAATLIGANLYSANFTHANLSKANLSGAFLNLSTLVGTNLCSANLTDCSVYGISAWDVELDGAIQNGLVITDEEEEPIITVDSLKIAQFIYLLLNNQEIRDIIDTIAKKAVLILGRFTPERKAVLDALKDVLRQRDYLPILFDFQKPTSQDFTETVSTLAHISRFIIADLTDPSCSPYEVGTIAHNHVKPLQPEIARHEFAMLTDLRQRYYWVLPTQQYHSIEDLVASLQDKVIAPAEQMINRITLNRKEEA